MHANSDARTVGTVATLTGVSVRTLHHYDHIGLVVPSVRTAAGYRGYTDADIERLHLVLVYRSVGLGLDEIRTLLDDVDADVLAHLHRQHRLLCDQAEQLEQKIKAVEELMSAHNSGIQLTAEEQVELFGTTAFSEEYAEEAQQRWGDTEEWRQSQERTAKMTKRDWIEFKAENDALLQALAAGKRSGVEAGSAAANALAARHRANISRFFDCSDDMHMCLARIYVEDERYGNYYDDAEPGLAQFVHDIIVASIN
ncbi:putative transcriptional regulator [Mycolicibacterium mageritense DSM 44476 = CIP 104973]|uniref:HTH-type transcriptional activator TipA n=2 Tax=Mycolicibacterium mageritense TaxID=53462 RepID=A0ABN5Y5T2_MYCME|nr:MerR family transcriptional regulator [Mycolicibacterium mageritense]OKH62437.1 transcriptional regulator [Mycobacterium sp. SWH-M3]MCC9184194.1 MerR family transcriptional regulator [Mycolicibacterium mageritense]TXI62583.1 MAG: MerR family transcriptional regulator [Mycolicibacterium mageritense]CDO21936.1 putative transcriptional regulator [Mycolicibacterium mageritense DSM 44476 = CIP 104973]BBX33506.1 HTH-type transcriptional activator TipA [Mycolicibacterium mageritense]